MFPLINLFRMIGLSKLPLNRLDKSQIEVYAGKENFKTSTGNLIELFFQSSVDKNRREVIDVISITGIIIFFMNRCRIAIEALR